MGHKTMPVACQLFKPTMGLLPMFDSYSPVAVWVHYGGQLNDLFVRLERNADRLHNGLQLVRWWQIDREIVDCAVPVLWRGCGNAITHVGHLVASWWPDGVTGFAGPLHYGCVCRWQCVGNAMGHVGHLVASLWPDGVIWVRWPIAVWVCAGGNVLVVRSAFGEHVGWACGPFMYCAIGLPF